MALDCIYPDWPAPAWVRALFTTRSGGTSAAPFHSLNLGDHVGDNPAAVQANRTLLAQHTGVPMHYLQQVHACDVVALGHATSSYTYTPYTLNSLDIPGHSSDSVCYTAKPPVADACYSTQPGQGCVVLVADCLPVLFCHRQYPIVAAAHAGWRGLAGVGPDGIPAPTGVLENTVRHMQQAIHSGAGARGMVDWLAWLGPCIGPAAFEVGDEVRRTFTQALHAVDADAVAACFVPSTRPGQSGKWLAHLPALARLRLRALGIEAIYGNDGSASWCTASNPQRYFSYRMQGRTGRMAACIWLDAT